MQYTGLTDINEKEIYAGDIVSVSEETYKSFQVVGWEKTYEVPYYCIDYFDNIFGFGICDVNDINRLIRSGYKFEKVINYLQPRYLWLIKSKYKNKVEIVGNRYENPEIIEREERK